MVPVTFNLHSYKERVKQSIVQREATMDCGDYPLDWAWLTYALGQDGKENNPLFSGSLAKLLSWASSDPAWSQERSLAALALCAYLAADDDARHDSLASRLLNKLEDLLEKEVGRFSPLNDPGQVFCIVLGTKGRLDRSLGQALKEICLRNSETGRLMRRALYTAALLELGKLPRAWPVLDDLKVIPEDVIAILWLYQRYKEKSTQDAGTLWKAFENVKDSFALESPAAEEEGLPPLSNLAIALLYEALAIQTRKPDVDMLFDAYPLHTRVRQIAEGEFKAKAYVSAVEQATRALNELIQQKTGVTDKSEAELVQATMKQIDCPDKLRIKFNDFLHEDAGRNEQAGLALIAEGVFKAFRNPKGHKPKDHPLVELDGYEALDQLVIISFLMKRIEEAQGPSR
jgi:uncharacterized protein (TIGR02391 family)